MNTQDDQFGRSALWFIPATLACIVVLSGLCLFFIQRQSRAEESQLREQERFCLEKTQQLFREILLQEKWQNAISSLPAPPLKFSEFRVWDQNLGEGILGFALDNSGMLFYPPYQVYPQPQTLSPALAASIYKAVAAASSDPLLTDGRNSTESEDHLRRLSAALEKQDREKAIHFARLILVGDLRAGTPVSQAAAMKATEVLLQEDALTEDVLGKEGELVDAWLTAVASNDVQLTNSHLPWVERLQEQCRRRDERESWLAREKQFARLALQVRWAEKFLYRLNLVLRRNLYNTSRTQLPTRFLNSDPNEEPYIVMFRFVDHSELSLIGVAVDLEAFSSRLQAVVARASWLPDELSVQITKHATATTDPAEFNAGGKVRRERELRQADPAGSGKTSQSQAGDPATGLVEQGILDPLAPQFLVEVMPRDLVAFRQKSILKNFLYLSTVLLAIGTSLLVLFFGQRSVKEQQRLAKLRADFLTNVSHELKTPLTAIRLHAETLERQLGTAHSPTSSSLETILGEVDRLSLLINDVLEFTRLENDKKRFVWESVDLVTVVKESYQLFQQQLEESEFAVQLKLPETMILERADRAALKQCAVNLISNSLKYSTQEKFLAIRLGTSAGMAIWEIEDRGIGIPSEEHVHVFEKFYRGKGLDPALSGTGLGLTLCKAFIEAHGGSIQLRHPPAGQGTLFVIHLPLQLAGSQAKSLTQEHLQSNGRGSLVINVGMKFPKQKLLQ